MTVPEPASHLRSCLIVGVRPVRVAGPGVGVGPLVDVRIVDGVITEIGPGLTPRGEERHDGGGRYALPGLWDAHVHFGQWAMTSQRLDLSGVAGVEEACARVREHVAALPAEAAGLVVQGYGHRTATWARQPDVASLDAAVGDRPVVLISGDAHHGWLNSAALAALGVPERPGVVEEDEWFALFPRLAELPGSASLLESGYGAAMRAAAAAGVVGVTDMEWGDGYRDWPARFVASAGRPARDTLRVRTATYPDGLEAVLAAGLRTGDPLPGGGGLLTMGPLKVITDGSLNTRTAYCCEPFACEDDLPAPRGVQNVPVEELTQLLRRARAGGLTAALHAIGDAAVADVVAAFEASGAVGAVEHAQLVRVEDLPRMAALGVVASVQPAHLLDDRDVIARYWPDRQARCFAFASLTAHGVPLRLGSDAPVAPLDPWLAMAAAVHRSADERPPWVPQEAIGVAQALAASTDGVAALQVGGPGDVVLVDRDPLAVPSTSREVGAALRAMPVAATVVAGRLVHGG